MHLTPPAPDDDSDVSIDRPVFIFGVPRSGTTLTLALMASHPDLGWSSQYTNRFPKRPELALYSRLLDFDLLRRFLSTSWPITPRPSEPYTLLNYVTASAFTQPRPLAEADVTSRAVVRYRHAVRQHLHWQGKSRYLQKHTGFPRTPYLRTIFPDARFVHVLRDGRAVASSLVHVGFFDGTMDTWMWGPMRPEFEQEYLESGRSPIVLAAIWWKTLIDLIEPAMAELPAGHGMTVRYDALIARPEAAAEEIAEFCGLKPSPQFDRRVRRIRVNGSDDKWRHLPQGDQRLLEASLGDYLERLGFS
jgi:omega-hydroxy-beta-dihydromenaquinone-9 sulfotransferase